MNPSVMRILGSALPEPDSIWRVSRKEWLFLSLLTFITLVRNFLFIVPEQGEQDLARLLNDALIWHHTGELPFADYRAKTSPGYLYFLKGMYDAGISSEDIIRIINRISAVSGAVFLFLSYFFFRTLLPALPALACGIVLFFAPSIFVLSTYGFPTLIAYVAFYFSLLAFVQATIVAPTSKPSILLFSIIGLALATIIKADVILVAPAYLGVVVLFGKVDRRRLLLVLLVSLVGALAPIIFKSLFLPNHPVATAEGLEFASNWSDRFPFSFQYLVSEENIGIHTSLTGSIVAACALAGMIKCSSEERTRRLVWVILLSGLPLFLFWGSRPGNIARHMLAMTLPFVLFVGYLYDFFRARKNENLLIFTSTFLILVANYFSRSVNASTVAPSTRLVESSKLRNIDSIASNAEPGLVQMSLIGGKLLLIDNHMLPYSLHAILRHTVAIEKWTNGSDAFDLELILRDKTKLRVVGVYEHQKAEAVSISKQHYAEGFSVWSTQFPFLRRSQ